MNRNRHGWPVALILLLILVASFLGGNLKNDPDSVINLASLIPNQLGDWKEAGPPPAIPQTDLEFLNEFFQCLFRDEMGRTVSLIVEYGSDSRRRHEIHLPEYCHRARGDVIRTLSGVQIQAMGTRSFPVALMEWEYPQKGVRALCGYWVVVGGRRTTNVWRLKFDQFFSGILSRPRGVVLVRADVFYSSRPTDAERFEKIETVTDFFQSMLENLPNDSKSTLLGQF